VVREGVGELGGERPDLASHSAEVVQEPCALRGELGEELCESQRVHGPIIGIEASRPEADTAAVVHGSTESSRFLPLLFFGPLCAAVCVALFVRDVPAASLTIGTALLAGAAAACAAAWKGERWQRLLMVGIGAAAIAAFLTFGIGATLGVGAWLVDPCNGSCLP
jgi:hypothetical protein